jgi:hypothetical protein
LTRVININDDGEVTELTDLDVTKVSGVTRGANGTPFIVIKSAADPYDGEVERIRKEMADGSVKRERIEALFESTDDLVFKEFLGEVLTKAPDNTGGPGLKHQQLDADSDEPDEATRIANEYMNGDTIKMTAIKNNRGEELHALIKSVAETTTDAEREAQLMKASHTALVMEHEGRIDEARLFMDSVRKASAIENGAIDTQSLAQSIRGQSANDLSIAGRQAVVDQAQRHVVSVPGVDGLPVGNTRSDPNIEVVSRIRQTNEDVGRLEKQISKRNLDPIERDQLGLQLTKARLELLQLDPTGGIRQVIKVAEKKVAKQAKKS